MLLHLYVCVILRTIRALFTFIVDASEARHNDRPLTEHERKRLQSLRVYLVDTICMNSDLLEMLSSKGCISSEHMKSIRHAGAAGRERDQTREMLDIIERRSYAHYRLFLECLRATRQVK